MREIDPNLPVDRIAARVVSKVSDIGRSFRNTDTITSMSPLPTMQWPYAKSDDLTGRKCGRFTVIGYALWRPKTHQKNNVRWVVRCVCGRYQMLTTKAVKNNNINSACVECNSNKNQQMKLKKLSLLLALIILMGCSGKTICPTYDSDIKPGKGYFKPVRR